jgi:hypothetical protein
MKQVFVAFIVLSLLSISNISLAAPGGFCESYAKTSHYFWQQSIVAGGSNVTTGNDGGYNYSESTGITLPQGSSNIELNPGYRSYNYPVYWRGWLDLNEDNQFTADEQLFEATSRGPITVPITVNSHPGTDSSTLRIAMKYGSYPQSCEIYYYGETEDLVVSIQQADSQPVALEDNYHLTADHDFTLHRTGSIGDKVGWVIERNGVISLSRAADSELQYRYFNNQQGADFRVWLEEYINGSYQRVSNIIEYTPGITDQYELSLGDGFQLFRSGQIGDSLIWVIERDGKIVLQRNAANELDYIYYNNSIGSQYRVWLKQFINGQYEIVSNTVEYEVGQTEFTLTLDQMNQLRRNGQPGDQVSWVIEQDGQIVLQRNASNEMTYSYFNNTPGSTYRVWLEMYLNGQYQIVSNIVEYVESAYYDFTLTLGAGYTITRSGALGDSVNWVIIMDGAVVLQRYAGNELSYTYYRNFPGSSIDVYLEKFIGGAYQQVSNTVHYTVQ